MPAASLLLIAAITLSALFALTFFVSYWIENYSWVDVVWSYGIGALGLFYAGQGVGWAPRRAILAGLTAGWSLRLGTHLSRRLWRLHPAEDPRYRELRERWGSAVPLKMAGVFQLQALLILVLGLPLLFAVQDPTPRWRPLEAVGALLWVAGILGESIADRQLAKFKQASTNREQVCAVGLWRYSRHPNYFCEWLIWVAAFLFALPSPGGWVGLSAPVAMLIFLAGVTGIPPAERQSVRSKGELYRRYQATTSAFFPWPPRRSVWD